MGGSLNLEILGGGGLKQFWKSRWKGGSKNRAFCRGGVDFFWNNPIYIHNVTTVSKEKEKLEQIWIKNRIAILMAPRVIK